MKSYRKPSGWKGEPYRHYLAAKGIATKKKIMPYFAMMQPMKSLREEFPFKSEEDLERIRRGRHEMAEDSERFDADLRERLRRGREEEEELDMKSWRRDAKGWRGDAYGHRLAAMGISTKSFEDFENDAKGFLDDRNSMNVRTEQDESPNLVLRDFNNGFVQFPASELENKDEIAQQIKMQAREKLALGRGYGSVRFSGGESENKEEIKQQLLAESIFRFDHFDRIKSRKVNADIYKDFVNEQIDKLRSEGVLK
jgi:hypothetical protein